MRLQVRVGEKNKNEQANESAIGDEGGSKQIEHFDTSSCRCLFVARAATVCCRLFCRLVLCPTDSNELLSSSQLGDGASRCDDDEEDDADAAPAVSLP